MSQRNGANIHLISNPQNCIDMITLTHKSNLSLPKSVRTYIDGCAYEYTEIDAWTKLAHIAYLVKRGANLLPEFIEDIERHMENPAYGNYENTAKGSIANYIELLRSDNKQAISYITLPGKMSFAALFQLLIEELLYRYWERDLDDNKVECIFDEVHYDYDAIALRYKGDPDATKHFIKYISTSKETLRNIDVSEVSLKNKNGWNQLTMKMFGYTVWSDKEEDELIYPGDAPFIHAFNEKSEQKYKYVVGVPPMPYSGNILESKVVMLTLNPGYIEKVNKDKCLALRAAEKEQLLCLMREALTFGGMGIYDGYECSRIQGDYYWERAFSRLAMDAYNSPSTEKLHPIYHDMAFLQLIGYHSEKFKYAAGIKHLPSVIFTTLLVKYLATKTSKTFLVLRSEELWKEIMGEDLWNKLEFEGRIITKGHKGMSQAITPGNIKKDNAYYKLVSILNR